ncbi:MAG: hypothetical protein SVX43_11945 [Cyanobacteriota bacterium]|nr:hypothetical protein [Cyanobacteriota bacterium]
MADANSTVRIDDLKPLPVSGKVKFPLPLKTGNDLHQRNFDFFLVVYVEICDTLDKRISNEFL